MLRTDMAATVDGLPIMLVWHLESVARVHIPGGSIFNAVAVVQ
jgi:hypothetical protein